MRAVWQVLMSLAIIGSPWQFMHLQKWLAHRARHPKIDMRGFHRIEPFRVACTLCSLFASIFHPKWEMISIREARVLLRFPFVVSHVVLNEFPLSIILECCQRFLLSVWSAEFKFHGIPFCSAHRVRCKVLLSLCA
jgi:hypothetical protein